MKKAVIGIVSKHYKENKTERTDTYIRDEVKQAIFDNGAVAIGILPPDKEIKDIADNWKEDLSKEEYDSLISQIKLCDGIIFQGGMAADNYENIAAKYCYKNNIPVLGICCGQNIIARAIGGTTYKIPNPEKHMQPSKEMEEAKKTLITSEQQSIIDAGGRVESFYDTFEENRTEGELIEYKRLIGMPITDDYDELIASLK